METRERDSKHNGAEVDPLAAALLNLDDLEQGRHELEFVLPASWVGEVLADTDANVGADGRARLELTVQHDRTLLVRGRLELGYEVPCARCLEAARVEAGVELGELVLIFVPAERLRSWSELGTGLSEAGDEDDLEIAPLEPDELDQIGYEGKQIDLRSALAEQVLLTYPMRALCSLGEACRGLCPSCGANLNEAGPGELVACPSCGARLDGGDEAADTPWKRALAKLDTAGDTK